MMKNFGFLKVVVALSATLFYSYRAQSRSFFCSSAKNSNDKNVVTADERYRQLENLDMMTAAKILFTDPPKKKKFGFDFHLVQFFFACMPSLAVYLVAQYARYQMRTMEVEVEQKKKLRDEDQAKEKEKEMELNPPEVSEAKSDPQLSEVKERLDKLEEAVKEIAVVTKKQSSSSIAKNQLTDDEKKPLISSAPRDASTSSASNKPIEVDRFGKDNSHTSKAESAEECNGSMATQNSSPQDPKSQNQSGRAS